MKWLTWEQALMISAVSGLVLLVLRSSDAVARRVPRRLSWVEPAAVELTIIWSLYAVWRLARQLPLTHEAGAMERGLDIWRFERWIHMPSELYVQRFIDAHPWLGPPVANYYVYVHVPATLAFLVWLFARHRDRFPHWRNGIMLTTAFCLVIRYVRVAPPRFFPELGFVDLAAKYGPDVYGPIGTGVSDQFAAMPSIHVAWAAVVSFGAFAATTSRWRWLVLMHVIVTQLVVSGTAHHWWMDGIVGVALLWLALAMDSRVRASAPTVQFSPRLVVSQAMARARGLSEPPTAGASVDSAPDPALVYAQARRPGTDIE